MGFNEPPFIFPLKSMKQNFDVANLPFAFNYSDLCII